MKHENAIKFEEESNLVGATSIQESDLHFHLMMTELVDQLQDAPMIQRNKASLHKMVACNGDAYFFYNETGDFCLLTDFLVK